MRTAPLLRALALFVASAACAGLPITPGTDRTVPNGAWGGEHVSLTVTEGGYNLDSVTGSFRAADPLVQADLLSPAAPQTVFGLVTEALARRRDRGIPAFSILSCDNMPGNGHVSRSSSSFISSFSRSIRRWICSHAGTTSKLMISSPFVNRQT